MDFEEKLDDWIKHLQLSNYADFFKDPEFWMNFEFFCFV